MSRKNLEVIITDRDSERLDALLSSAGGSKHGLLEKELDRAQVVPQAQVPPDVVTMNSVVTFVDELSGEEMRVALVYPSHSAADEGRISILAPLGSALLGLRVGQTLEFPLPNGKSRLIRVKSLDFQPEALGAFDL